MKLKRESKASTIFQSLNLVLFILLLVFGFAIFHINLNVAICIFEQQSFQILVWQSCNLSALLTEVISLTRHAIFDVQITVRCGF